MLYFPHRHRTRCVSLITGAACALFLATTAQAQKQPTGRTPPQITRSEFAYVDSASAHSLNLYRVETDGRFSALSPANITYSDIIDSLTADPKGRYLYVSCRGEGIRQYKIHASGALTPLSPAVVAVPPPPQESDFINTGMAVHPGGRYLYVADATTSRIQKYTISSDGQLSSRQPPVVSDKNVYRLAIHPNGKTLYALLREPAAAGEPQPTSYIGQYRIKNNGDLTPLSPAQIYAGEGASSIAINGPQQAVYVVNSFNDPQCISQFHIGASGALTPLSPSVVASGFSLDAAVGGSSDVVVSPDGLHAYATNNPEGTVVGYTVAANGALINPDKQTLRLLPAGLGIRPSDGSVYVASRTIQRVTMDAHGKMSVDNADVLPLPAAQTGRGATSPPAPLFFRSVLIVRQQQVAIAHRPVPNKPRKRK